MAKATILGKSGLHTIDLNRRRAIRERCLNCACWSIPEVDRCPFRDCTLFAFRSGKGKQDPKERGKAIKAYCLWCQNGQPYEIRMCPSVHCPLHGFRGSRNMVADCPDLLPKCSGERTSRANTPKRGESATGGGYGLKGVLCAL
ncbi:MAG: hypothetical protein C4576_23305 [Desulfobacteraceae bacterium]|nr:MAG: hypothetical protein C4576_23305 [Desulfobacteraceae bacterium]